MLIRNTMPYYAYVPREDGSEPMGTEFRVIFRDLKTIRGVKARLSKFSTWIGKPYKVFTFSNFYNESTFRLVYTHKV